jgi:hypothetical protein
MNEKNVDDVKLTIVKLENPNPIIIVIIIITTIVLFYFSYAITIKKSLTDKYHDDNYNIYHIKHCKFTDSIVIHGLDNYNSRMIKNGIISITRDNKIVLGVCMSNCIKWTDNTTWHRII